MKKISIVLAIVLTFAMTVITVSAATVDLSLNSTAQTVDVNAEFDITLIAPLDADLMCGDFYLYYDVDLVEPKMEENKLVAEAAESTIVNKSKTKEGQINIAAASDDEGFLTTDIAKITFVAKADGEASFTFSAENLASFDGTVLGAEIEDFTTTGVTVTIGSTPDPVFTVSDAAYSNGTFTVKVANIPENTKGTVYAAIFDGDDVLKAAGEAILTEGTVTINNVTATGSNLTAKIFVWNDIMIPLWDVIPVTVQ